ncbi:hypothetical protein [Actinotalea ferrariae]|nr:hypothetical protein [Actinotalea ferrariae]
MVCPFVGIGCQQGQRCTLVVPVVFLVLPVTVLFAVFPGLVALRLDL